jgi:hypothetical protein
MPIPIPARARTVAYWLTTAIVTWELALGGIWDLLRVPYVRGVIAHLGYPSYFLVILGAWKLPGAVALLIPRYPRLKEWAYAGAFFNYTGAAASHFAAGDGPGAIVGPAIFALILMASWALRPPARR